MAPLAPEPLNPTATPLSPPSPAPTPNLDGIRAEGGENQTVLIASITVSAMLLLGIAVGFAVYFLIYKRKKGPFSVVVRK